MVAYILIERFRGFHLICGPRDGGGTKLQCLLL